MFVIQRPSLTTGATEQVAQQFEVSLAKRSKFQLLLEYNPTKFDNVDKNEPIKEQYFILLN